MYNTVVNENEVFERGVKSRPFLGTFLIDKNIKCSKNEIVVTF